jgi:hypothetical protein
MNPKGEAMTQRSMFDSDQVKVQAESTHILLNVDGVETRVWNAVTEDGEHVFLFVHRVASRNELSALLERPTPTLNGIAI